MARRQLLAVGLTVAALPAARPRHRLAEQPIRWSWIVPFTPGGAMNVIARTLGEKAGKSLGQPFVTENKAGASGNIGSDTVVKQPCDGYTLHITSIGMATNKPLYGNLAYVLIHEFAPVSLLAAVPNVLVTNATQPDVKTRLT